MDNYWIVLVYMLLCRVFLLSLVPAQPADNTTVSSVITSRGGFSSADDTTSVYSVINLREDDSPAGIQVYAVIVVHTLVFVIVAGLVIIVNHYRKNRVKKLKSFGIRQNTTVTETIVSSDYYIKNYNEMTGINIPEINKNRHEFNATNRQPQDIKTVIEQEDIICNKYESLATNRISVEHIYESDSIHTNQYESLTKPRDLDKHTYESTEHALPHVPQDIKTLIEPEDNICNKYESLSTNRDSVEHIYESDSINTSQYESLTKQREMDKHTYESTENALPQDIKTSIKQEDTICNKYELLSTNRISVEHIYESDSIHTNQYESLTKQRELDKHTYESTEHALPVSIEQKISQYQSLTNPPESNKHVYASTGSPQ